MKNTISTILFGDSRFDFAVQCGSRLTLDRGYIRHVQNLKKKLNSLDAPAEEIVSILHELSDTNKAIQTPQSLSGAFLEEFEDNYC